MIMGKEYNMNLTKRYKVTFVRDGVRFKKGDTTEVNMPLAAGLFKDGKINTTNEMLEDAKALSCEELFQKKK